MRQRSERKIDHTHLREWLVKMETLEPDTVSTVLEVIRENSGPKRREYAERFFEKGESISCIAEQCGVAMSTVSHTIQNALNECYAWLISNLPPEALYAGESEKQPQRKRYLHMSEDEIVMRYRQAKNKAEQITILADMNVTAKDVIREVLREHGFDIPESKRKHGRAPQSAMPLCVAAASTSGKKNTGGGRKKWPDPPMAPIHDVEYGKKEEGETMAKPEAKAMSLEVLSELTKNVKSVFPQAEVCMAAGTPGGAVLTVRWNEKGDVTASAFQIEAVG